MIKEEVKDIEPILLECFKEDKELLEKYHIEAGHGLEICAKRTLIDLIVTTSDSFKFFKLTTSTNELFGFFGTEKVEGDNLLTSFFIMPLFRNKLYKRDFWELIKSHFNEEPFKTAICVKNIRALNFCINFGGKVERLIIDKEQRNWLLFNFVYNTN